MLELRGAEQLTALAAKLKEAGDRGLQRELSKGLRKAAEPFKAAVAASAEGMLPSSGGLAGVAAAKSVPRISRSAKNGLRMVAKGKDGMKGLAQLNAGSVRHPVYGRNAWVTQGVTPGFWDKAVEQVAPEVRKQLELAVAEIVKKIGA